MRLKHTLAIASLLLFPVGAGAQDLGNATVGKEFAEKICADCHDVDPGGEISVNPDAPSFQSVADTPGMSARALAVWLQSSHPTMPNFILKPDDMDNVIAYIMSLRTKK